MEMTEKNAKRKKGKGQRKGKERRRHNSHPLTAQKPWPRHDNTKKPLHTSQEAQARDIRRKEKNKKSKGRKQANADDKKKQRNNQLQGDRLQLELWENIRHPARIVRCFRPIGCNFHESNQAAQNCSRHTLLEVETAPK